MTIRDMLAADVKIKERILIKSFDEERGELFIHAECFDLDESITELYKGDLILDAKVLEIYSEDENLVFIIEDIDEE